jgi:anti-anti-sigma regulatory factor
MTTPTLHIVKIAEQHGTVLAGRGLATAIREEVEHLIADGTEVILDFEGVEAVSPSFADEVFGKLVAAVGEEAITFTGMTPQLKKVATMAKSGREPRDPVL